MCSHGNSTFGATTLFYLPLTRPSGNNTFGAIRTGPTGKLVVVEASTDMVNWLPICTNTLAGPLNFSDPQSGVYSNRFYPALTP